MDEKIFSVNFDNKKLKAMIAPLFMEQFLLLAVGMADTLVISYVSEAAVSGVTLVDQFNVVLIYLFTALCPKFFQKNLRIVRQNPKAVIIKIF